MKNKLICFLLVLIPTVLFAQKKFQISGTIDRKMDGHMIKMNIILPPYAKGLPEQVTAIKDGKFFFQSDRSGFELYGFTISHAGKLYNQIIRLLPKDTKIEFQDTLLKKYKVFDDGFQLVFARESAKIKNDSLQLLKNIEANIKQPFGSYLLFSHMDRIPESEVIRLEKMIPNRFRDNSWYVSLKMRISKFMIGKPALEFSQNDPGGNLFKLSNLKGKYVLLDFWASWCIPCRKENPNLVRAFNKFNGKGFEILSVSLDTDKNQWVAAIKADGLTWHHVTDLKGWENSVSRGLYQVQSVPQNYLINPEGIIIAKNLYGNEIEKILEKVIP
ncbi:TlpA family protein disulfide reductase [Pedobacter frigoris]|uniref:TlpA family protein disulfide reductase n=1 Tax=Pedobacter frigoris TaxID=2571272 RepID=A0A4U1CHU5_9SPHI|nr:TlpA disulfide reductase family protein [Pedobacter frigoris]TKC06947.1 TlpA family protein disulfide reductase [Pedobacter frigoris]